MDDTLIISSYAVWNTDPENRTIALDFLKHYCSTSIFRTKLNRGNVLRYTEK